MSYFDPNIDIARFAARLREAAAARGKTSARAKSGVALADMAKAVGISFELARRYADGLAMPRPGVIQSIADWLGVEVNWLLFGRGAMESKPILNLDVLESCIAAADEAQEIAATRLPATRLSALIAELYRDALIGVPPSARSVSAVIRAFDVTTT